MRLLIGPLLLLSSCSKDSAPPADSAPVGDPLCGASWVGPAAPKNLLMISIDTLRRDRLGRYAGAPERTPFLDGLLSEGLALDDHRSCSDWTYPSVLCALTGRYNEENDFFPRGGQEGIGEDDQERTPPVPDEVVMLPDLMRDRGFASGIASGNLFLGSRFNIGNRYDHERVDVYLADEITDRALEIADALAGDDRPWFLHAHYLDPHDPYNPPESYITDAIDQLEPTLWDPRTTAGTQTIDQVYDMLSEQEQALLRQHVDVYYNGELTFTDDQIERLLSELDRRGMLDDTLVMLWSDHGEQFWEHGQFRHHQEIYGEETLAVAGFWMKGAEGVAWTGPTTHSDLLPTALCLMDLEPYEAASGLAVGAAEPDRLRLSMVLDDRVSQHSIERETLRLIYFWDGRLALFDLAADPSETVDLSAKMPEETGELWALLEPWVDLAAPHHDYQEPVDPEL